jgi:hypothetical protein
LRTFADRNFAFRAGLMQAMSPELSRPAPAADHPAAVMRPFAWTAGIFFAAGFVGYALVALLAAP